MFVKTSRQALDAYIAKNLPSVEQNVSTEVYPDSIRKHYPDVDQDAKLKMHVNVAMDAAKAISALSKGHPDFLQKVSPVLLPYLDTLHGSSIDASDHGIFTKLTQEYEARFMEDSRALNILDPDIITRVTEYGQGIVEFVQQIQQNGFAYATSDGSVYFDIAAFEAANNSYARLEPWNRNDANLQSDGEGALSKKNTEKRSDADFALWKSSKPGEPSWKSPWGLGRPGWHIECSAMASDKLGKQIDIHSGGIDLAFPHHDNELAQSEAYWLEKEHDHPHQWVNYFMHMGHLSIQGAKMSKSLKNFTTIRTALERGDWTARGLRIVFLLGSWKDGIEITEDLVKAGSAWEDKVNNFFIKTIDIVQNQTSDSPPLKAESDDTMSDILKEAKKKVHDSLANSFDTPAVMTTISEFITDYNSQEKTTIGTAITTEAARWVTSLVNTFGLNGTASPNDTALGWSGIDIPEAAKSLIYPLSAFRDELRRKARSPEGITRADLEPAQATSTLPQTLESPYSTIVQSFSSSVLAAASSPNLSKDILALCDHLRDTALWDVDIYLEDRDGNQPALVRPVTKELRALRRDKEEKERQRLKAKEDREREAAAKADKGRLSHLEMYRTEEFSAWDEEGMPLKDKEGVEVAKSRTKKLRKEWERQKKLHEAWVKTGGEGKA